MDLIKMYVGGMSIPEVSKETGLSMSTVRLRLKDKGVLRSKADGVRLAAKKGKLGKSKGLKRVFSEEHKARISKAKLGKGVGFSKKKSGYVEITMGENKGRAQHTVVAEKTLGRKLFSNECVHHIDFDRANNNPENLQVMTKSEHASLHAAYNLENRERNKKGQFI